MEEQTKKEKKKITQEDIMKVLDKAYDKAICGIEKVSPSIDALANDYLAKNEDVNTAAKSFIKYQIAKCGTSGFLSGLGGLITLPVTIPANIGSVMYVQMRMIACLAHMGGYDIKSDQVQTLVYACLSGVSIDSLVKNLGIQVGLKTANSLVKKIPGKTLIAINKKIGFRLLTKFGEKGVINIHKYIPLVGGIVGGTFDLVETKIIADRAYKMFILNDFTKGKNEVDAEDVEEPIGGEVVEVEIVDETEEETVVTAEQEIATDVVDETTDNE